MKRTMLLTLVLAVLVNTAGCCSIIHAGNYSTSGSRGAFRPMCYFLGNLFFGGLIGWVVDLADGAAWEPAESTADSSNVSTNSPYELVCGYEEGDENPGSRIENEYLQVELTDGTIIVLANVRHQSGGESPDGSLGIPENRIAKKTWVVPVDPDYSPRPPKACELAAVLHGK